MVVLTHSTKVSNSHSPPPPFPNKEKGLSKREDGASDGRRLFNLVAFIIVAAFLTKFIVEFRIQERLRVKPHEFNKTYRLEEQHEIIEVIVHPAYHNQTNNLTIPLTDSQKESIFQVELIDIPPSTSLLNISDFKWLRNNVSICTESVSSSTKLLPVLIHTSRNHFMERKAIRATWASIKNYRNWSVRPVFLIGEAGQGKLNESEEAELDKEHQYYGDVITGSFIDSYRNLTYKHLMGYKWILEYCVEATFVLKTDDDMFVDVLHFIDKFMNGTNVKEETATLYQKPTDLYCHQFTGTGPARTKSNKWYVSVEEWPEPNYPFYCSGWGYGISVEWIDKIYLMSSQTRYFWVDDVFIGILINMAKSFYNEEGPKVDTINHLYTFDNRLYVEMCKNWGGGQNETYLEKAKRRFASIVFIARNADFGMEMECLWRKTLMDRNMITTG